jgi:hypothetical protein
MSIKPSIGVLFLALFSTIANAEGWWATLARSPDSSVWRISLGQTLSKAESDALSACGTGCRIELISEPHQCMAVVDGAEGISWHVDETLALAVEGAFGACNKKTSGCALAGTECGTNKILSEPELIRQVQRMLKALGYYMGQVTGIIAPDAQKALEDYRALVGIERSGELTVWDHNWITRSFEFMFDSSAERHAILNQPDS